MTSEGLLTEPQEGSVAGGTWITVTLDGECSALVNSCQVYIKVMEKQVCSETCGRNDKSSVPVT